MRKSALLPALLLFLPLPALADTAYITAMGQGTATAPPDTVTLNAGVTNSAKTAREALSQNSQAMTKVFTAMRALNIPERNIRTTSLNLQPQYAPTPQGSYSAYSDRPVIGYRANNDVSVTIEDVAKAGPALDALVNAGANQSGGIRYSIRDTKKLLDQARADAVKDAMARAKIYAATAGVTLGPLHFITDVAPGSAFGDVETVNSSAGRIDAPEFAPPPPIGVGEQSLRVTVTVSWEVRP